MNDFRWLFRFVRPYLPILAFSLLLLLFAGIFEVLTTALAIPLFDKVLVVQQSAPIPVSDKMEFLQRYLALIPGSVITQLSVALLALPRPGSITGIFLTEFHRPAHVADEQRRGSSAGSGFDFSRRPFP
jgi:hypothetical protein